MLTCYGHSVRLPQSDLAYLAFRLAHQEMLSTSSCISTSKKNQPHVRDAATCPFS